MTVKGSAGIPAAAAQTVIGRPWRQLMGLIRLAAIRWQPTTSKAATHNSMDGKGRCKDDFQRRR